MQTIFIETSGQYHLLLTALHTPGPQMGLVVSYTLLYICTITAITNIIRNDKSIKNANIKLQL